MMNFVLSSKALHTHLHPLLINVCYINFVIVAL